MAAAELNTDIRRCHGFSLNLPILQAFLYQINGQWAQIANRDHIVKRAIVCSSSWLASRWGHGAVGERHGVGRAIRLALVAVLVVHCVVLRLGALDLGSR